MTKTHSDIPSVLQRIVATKVEEVKAAREALSLEDLKAQVAADDKPRRGFAAALRAAGTKENGIGIIAEIKKKPHRLKALSIITLPLLYLRSSMSKQALVVCLY